jgi:hypothetical protein
MMMHGLATVKFKKTGFMNIFQQTIMMITGQKILSLGHYEWKTSKAMNMNS